MKHLRKHRIEKLVAYLTREVAQSKPDYTVALAVISGTSVLPFTRLSESAASAITGLVRLFI